MDISWIIFIGALSFFAWRGYRQGPWLALSRLVSLIAAYGVAFRFSQPLSHYLSIHLPLDGLPLDGMAGRIVAGLLLFLTVGFLVSASFSLIDKLLSRGHAGVRSSFPGALIGAGVGSLFGLVGVLFAGYLQDVGASRDATARKPGILETTARAAGASLFESAIGALGGDRSTTRMGAALLRDPAGVVKSLQSISHNPQARQLFSSPAGQAALASGDTEAILNQPAFRKLAASPEMKSLMESAGLSEGADREQALAEELGNAWGRLQSLREDPEVQELLRDRELREKLAKGDSLALLSDPRLASLLESFQRGDQPAPTRTEQGAAESPESASREPATIYQWRDANGQLHLSDSPPPE